jgi:hypothetical protein
MNIRVHEGKDFLDQLSNYHVLRKDSVPYSKKVKVSRYTPWRRLGGEEV